MLASVSACFCYLVAPQPEEPIKSGVSHICAEFTRPLLSRPLGLLVSVITKRVQALLNVHTRIQAHAEQASLSMKNSS
jgi:hypothetical protein